MDGVSDLHGSFGQRTFGRCFLGDPRRTRRLVQVADQLLAHPDKALPHKFACPADYRAALRLVNTPVVTHQTILYAHALPVLDRLRRDGPPVVVLPEDTTELDYSGQTTLALGPIGNGGGQGYECHNTLAVDPDSREIFGLVDQILHQRPRQPTARGVRAKRDDPQRESRLWLRASANVGPAPAGKRWVRVCDRGADSFEYLEHQVRLGRDFVFRSCQNRSLEVATGDDGPTRLHDRLRTLAATATWTVTVAARPGQPARTAALQAVAVAVRVCAPHVRRGQHGREPVAVWAIRVWEPEPPVGVAALEWLLLTNLEITDARRLREVVKYYECRGVVEEFHKAQKTGVGIEALQLQSRAGLEPLLALLSVVAVALVNLRQAARQAGSSARPARTVVEPLWVRVLSLWRYREARELTVLEFTLALARLGGHQNRKCDGLPGWQTLWRGWERLRTMLDYERARATCGKH